MSLFRKHYDSSNENIYVYVYIYQLYCIILFDLYMPLHEIISVIMSNNECVYQDNLLCTKPDKPYMIHYNVC